MPPWHQNCQSVVIQRGTRLPICNDPRQSGPPDWEIGKWTTPRTVKSFLRKAKPRLMVVPSTPCPRSIRGVANVAKDESAGCVIPGGQWDDGAGSDVEMTDALQHRGDWPRKST